VFGRYLILKLSQDNDMSRDIILKVDVYVCNYENVLDRLG